MIIAMSERVVSLLIFWGAMLVLAGSILFVGMHGRRRITQDQAEYEKDPEHPRWKT